MNTYGTLTDDPEVEDIRQHWKPQRYAPRIGGLFDKTLWVLRGLLPLCGIVLGVITVAYPFVVQQESSFVLARDSVETSQERLRMVNPRYSGMDARDRPFQIRAATAVQPRGVADQVALTDIEANMSMKDATDVAIVARDGIYKPAKEQLVLSGNVAVMTSNAYTIDASDSLVDLDNRIVSSQKRVAAHGPLGRFFAESFEALIDEDKLIFTGGVKAHIIPRKDAQQAPDAGSEPIEEGQGE